MAFTTFVDGVPLTAAELNDYLMQQSVMRFSTAAARTTALSGLLAEGLVSYVDATDTFETYNGSAWVVVNMPTAVISLGSDFTVPAAYASTGLVLALGASMTYEMSGLLSITQTGAGGDWSVTGEFTLPAGATLTWGGHYTDAANNIRHIAATFQSGALPVAFAASAAASVITYVKALIITSTTAGDLTLTAQESDDTSGTRLLKTGSFLTARRVA